MAKKLIRTYHPNKQQLLNLKDSSVSIVLKDKSVYFGNIKEIKNDSVIFRDKINNKIIIPLDNIMEIIVDEIHSF